MGSLKKYLGCTDKTPPIECREIYINGELYFAKSSKLWNNQWVTFLKNCSSQKSKTLGRTYLINEGQFIQIIEQEIGRFNIAIDFEKAKKEGSIIFAKKSWYGKVIFLGDQSNHPIFTFTSEFTFEATQPSENYLKTITDV